MSSQARKPLIEVTGALPMPPQERHSSRRNIINVFAGGNFWWGAALYGWIVAQFGLDFWSTLTAILAGTLLGSILVAPIGVMSYRTGTNVPVASTLLFGRRGRLIGTLLSFVIALIFTSLTVWTSGDVIVASLHRWLGSPTGPAQYALGYAVVALIIIFVGILGHELIVGAQRVLAPISGVLMLLGIFALAPDFAAHPVVDGYVLGSPFATWALAFAIGFSAPISYAPILGDYTRKLADKKYSNHAVITTMAFALTIATWIPCIVGTSLAFSLHGATGGNFLPDLVNASPAWYVVPILVVAITGGFGQGVMGLYATGLDLSSLFPRLSRAMTTGISGLLAVALLYIGAFVFNIASSVEAIAILLGCLVAPWVAVLLLGMAKAQQSIDFDALSSLGTSPASTGTYSYRHGWNVPATLSWAIGATFGVLTSNTAVLTGPFAGSFGGIDVSVLGSLIVGGIAYLILRDSKGTSQQRESAEVTTELVADQG